MSRDVFSLEGRNIYLTGAAGQLGTQWREDLVRAGATVFPIDSQWPGHPVDVTDPAALRQAMDYYQDMTRPPLGGGMFGPAKPPAALICAAAIDSPPGSPGCGPFEDVPLEDWQRTLEVNLTGVMLCCQVFGAEMARAGHGSIVLVSSMYGLVGPDQRRYRKGFTKPAAYSASKAGLIGLTRYLATYWGPRGVRVNAVCFGALDRPDYEPKFRKSMESAIPLGRMARAGEWSGPIRFLVSEASSYMTGSVLTVDGGYTAW